MKTNRSYKVWLAFLIFLAVTILPELIGEDLKILIKPYFGDYYLYAIGGIGLTVCIIYFFTNDTTQSVNSAENSVSSSTKASLDKSQKVEHLAQKYSVPNQRNESWVKRTFGMETLSIAFIIDRLLRKDRPTVPEPQPSPEYEETLPDGATTTDPESGEPIIEPDGNDEVLEQGGYTVDGENGGDSLLDQLLD